MPACLATAHMEAIGLPSIPTPDGWVLPKDRVSLISLNALRHSTALSSPNVSKSYKRVLLHFIGLLLC